MQALPTQRASSPWIVLVWLMVGCSGGDRPHSPDGGAADSGAMPCGIDYLGDPSAPPQFTPTALGPSMTTVALAEGDAVSLLEPPQGGRVVFIGVQGATNLDPCGATLLAALRDPLSQQVRLDARTLNLQPGPDGKGASVDLDISTFSNVPLCPNQWSREAIFDQDYELVITLTDRQGRSATRNLTIRPTCNQADQAVVCRCICKKDYVLGESCAEADGGT